MPFSDILKQPPKSCVDYEKFNTSNQDSSLAGSHALEIEGNRRETQLLGIPSFVHTTIWKVLFGKVWLQGPHYTSPNSILSHIHSHLAPLLFSFSSRCWFSFTSKPVVHESSIMVCFTKCPKTGILGGLLREKGYARRLLKG
uniref:Uncharacterized protein n=1 Tax=Cucumis melo TaxID=3656 RepID=A0A9I9EIJ5_CUCME